MHHPSDDDDEIFAGSPQELMEKMKEVAKHRAMVATDLQHRVQRLFTDMDPESLAAMRMVLHSCAEDQSRAAFYEGVAAAILLVKHDVCSGCGVDHTKEAMEEILGRDVLDADPALDMSIHPPGMIDVQDATDEQEDFAERIVTLHRNLAEFGVLPVNRPKDGDYNGPVVCRSCGKEYVSLQDRMLEKPGIEGCEGCIEKAKWG